MSSLSEAGYSVNGNLSTNLREKSLRFPHNLIANRIQYALHNAAGVRQCKSEVQMAMNLLRLAGAWEVAAGLERD